ncbi:MAG TPA: hypothetical protein VFA09_07575 [Ktedonobacteraceae bacterium]|jgi:hypothetical protein|nr:hypothetical protein [Ktedonobacteraceae bacterium]
MNCVMPKLSGTGLNIEYIADPMSQWEDQYATTPMAAVQSIFRAPGEEELHTAFEQAISDRVMSVNRRLRHLSGPITAGGYAQPSTDQLIECDGTRISLYSRAATRVRHYPIRMGVSEPDSWRDPIVNARLAYHTNRWQRIVLMVCLCVLMMTLGFDLMGVLLMYGGR